MIRHENCLNAHSRYPQIILTPPAPRANQPDMSNRAYSHTENISAKICGLTREVDIESAVRYGARFLGFIVEASSKRRLSVAQAAKLAGPVRGIVSRVAVTVNATDSLLSRITKDMAPDFIQCHGEETVEHIAYIRQKFDVKIIKAVPIASLNDIKTAHEYAGIADYILYDAKPPKGSDIRGGHGTRIDWPLIKSAPRPKQFFLAGGLGPENVTQAIKQTGASFVDVSTGVEARAGVKEVRKIKAFMDAVNSL